VPVALTIKVTFATLYREPLSDGEEPKTIGWARSNSARRRQRLEDEHFALTDVMDEMRWARQELPQVKEFFFDDDTFTDDGPSGGGDRAWARQAWRHLVLQRQG
jgi:hypothetical protein